MAAEAFMKGTKDLPDPEVFVHRKNTSPENNWAKKVDKALQDIDSLGWCEEVGQVQARWRGSHLKCKLRQVQGRGRR